MSENKKTKRRLVLLANAAAVFLVVFVLAELILLPAPWTVGALRTHDPGTTAVMKERIHQAKAAHTMYKLQQTFIPLERIPDTLVHAVIVAEDGTFFEHHGVDWYEVRQSLEKDWSEKKIVRGSSTITMQLAKNLWFSTSRDPLTKFNEVIAAYMLEHYLTKDRILELYLNEIEFGPGIFGVEAASRHFFDKSVSGLSRDQAVRLAAVIPSPIRHTPSSNSRFISERSDLIQLRMESRGW